MDNVKETVIDMRNNPYIRKKELDNNVSSFNFTRKAFYDGHWNEQTIKARGLFIDTLKNKVVCRGYPKFFRYEEQGIDDKYLKDNIKFPVSVYQKENGFLGLFAARNGVPVFATKSQLDGPYNQYFKVCMKACVSDKQLSRMKDYCENNNCTLLFEVVDMEDDPHIIEYGKPYNIFLLDAVKNSLKFEKLPYSELINLSYKFNVPVKKKITEINNFDSLSFIINEILINSKDKIEGYVLEDASGFMFKLKTPYYSLWKHMRSVAGSVMKYGCYHKASNFIPNSVKYQFYNWLLENKNNSDIQLLVSQNRIIDIRNRFLDIV